MYVMENQSRIEELLAESLRKSDRISDQIDGLNKRFDHLTERVDHLTERVDALNDRMDRVEAEIGELKSDVSDLKADVKDLKGEVIKLNLVSAENSRALMKLADNAERIDRLERAVFKK
jgi:chromosome segregation ATPase